MTSEKTMEVLPSATVASRTFTVPLRATLPIKGKAPASTAYAYYTPEIEARAHTPVVSVVPAAQ